MSSVVLFVDDDIHLLDGICRALRKEPYEIVRAGSAEEGLEILSSRPVAVVISDEQMPGMSGTVFLGRAREKYPDTVRFMLTGKATVDVALEAINSGGITRFFVKPCASDELAVAIRQGLQHRELLLAARRLLQKGRHQALLIEQLEKSFPSITRVERDEDGAIPLEDWDGDFDQLMREICVHLEENK